MRLVYSCTTQMSARNQKSVIFEANIWNLFWLHTNRAIEANRFTIQHHVFDDGFC